MSAMVTVSLAFIEPLHCVLGLPPPKKSQGGEGAASLGTLPRKDITFQIHLEPESFFHSFCAHLLHPTLSVVSSLTLLNISVPFLNTYLALLAGGK